MIEITGRPKIPAYIVHPKAEAKAAIIVIHEVWGLNDHIKSVADHLASAGYVALAPDLLSIAKVDTSSLQGMQEALFDPEKRNSIQPKLRELMAPIQNPEFGQQTGVRLKACFDYLYALPEARQKVAVTGFCFGGSYSFKLAALEPRLLAAIPYYGHAETDDSVLQQIKCLVLAFYGGEDERLTEQLPDLIKAMDRANVDFSYKVYPSCGHAFFNDTNRFAYNESAAKDSWQRLLSTLDQLTSS